jgi:gas vesicle protein
MSDSSNTANFGIGLLVGAAVGVALGFLYAPRSGKEMRAMIREKGSEAWDRADEIIKEAEERAKRIIEDARGKAAELK